MNFWQSMKCLACLQLLDARGQSTLFHSSKNPDRDKNPGFVFVIFFALTRGELGRGSQIYTYGTIANISEFD